jgi:nicotinamide mononucleotide transporter
MFILEVVATILGVLCVGLLIYRNHWSWPIGLGQVILQGIVLWDAKLYAETGLQLVFAILQVYGWWAWLASRNHATTEAQGLNRVEEIQVETLSPIGWVLSLLAIGLGTFGLAWFLIQFTDGQAPWVDAFIASASLTAQYLLAKRYHANWTYWIVVDIVSIPLYLARGLFAFAILYVIFLGLAIAGWITWYWALKKQTELTDYRDASRNGVVSFQCEDSTIRLSGLPAGSEMWQALQFRGYGESVHGRYLAAGMPHRQQDRIVRYNNSNR